MYFYTYWYTRYSVVLLISTSTSIDSMYQVLDSSTIVLIRLSSREQFQKLVAFLLPIFGNVDGSWRVTSKLRSSTLIQVARRRSKVFQRVSASLVRVGDVQGVSRRHAVRGKKNPTFQALWGFLGGLKKWCV